MNTQMKKMSIPLLALALVAVSLVVYASHPFLASNSDIQNTKNALAQASAIQDSLDHKVDASQAASVGLAAGDGSTTPAMSQRDEAAQHLLNSVQGVLGQLEYKLQNQNQ